MLDGLASPLRVPWLQRLVQWDWTVHHPALDLHLHQTHSPSTCGSMREVRNPLQSPPNPPWRRRRYNVAALALVLLGGAVGAMTVLHLRQSGSSITQQPLSFYVHGRHGWLLPLALAAFGGSTIVLGIFFRRTAWSTGAAGWLIWFGVGMLVDAIAPADRWFFWEGPVTFAGVVHAVAAVLAPPLLLGAMAEVRRHQDELRPSLRTPLDILALAYLGGLAASGLSLLAGFFQRGPPPFIGLAERVLALAAVGWLALIARWAARRL